MFSLQKEVRMSPRVKVENAENEVSQWCWRQYSLLVTNITKSSLKGGSKSIQMHIIEFSGQGLRISPRGQLLIQKSCNYLQKYYPLEFTEYPLCTRHCSRCSRYSSEQYINTYSLSSQNLQSSRGHKITANTQHLLCAKPCSKHFTHICSFLLLLKITRMITYQLF